MELKKLDQCRETSYIEYNEAYQGTQEVPFSDILMNLDYETWILNSRMLEKEESLPNGYVPSHTYFLVDENDQIVGNVSIRIGLNDYLSNYGGNIGYIISPKYRGKKYGKIILELSLKQSKILGLERVLLTCDKENIASAKTIIGNGGILDSEYKVNEVEVQRYWIDLK